MEFTTWFKEVDRHCERLTGLSVKDLADQPFRDYYDGGMGVRETVQTILEEEGIETDTD